MKTKSTPSLLTKEFGWSLTIIHYSLSTPDSHLTQHCYECQVSEQVSETTFCQFLGQENLKITQFLFEWFSLFLLKSFMSQQHLFECPFLVYTWAINFEKLAGPGTDKTVRSFLLICIHFGNIFSNCSNIFKNICTTYL